MHGYIDFLSIEILLDYKNHNVWCQSSNHKVESKSFAHLLILFPNEKHLKILVLRVNYLFFSCLLIILAVICWGQSSLLLLGILRNEFLIFTLVLLRFVLFLYSFASDTKCLDKKLVRTSQTGDYTSQDNACFSIYYPSVFDVSHLLMNLLELPDNSLRQPQIDLYNYQDSQKHPPHLADVKNAEA